MRNELKIGALIRVILVVAIIAGASGCATQGSGGSKLDHDMLRTQVGTDARFIEVCTQAGVWMTCHYEDEEEVRATFERNMEMLNNDFSR